MGIIMLIALLLPAFLLGKEPIEVSPRSWDFGTIEGGRASEPVLFKVKNVYGKDLVFGTVNISGKDPMDFRLGKDLCSYSIIKDGGTCEVEVLFHPRVWKEKPGIYRREAILVIPLSEIPTLEKVRRATVPLYGTVLIKEKN